MRGLSRREERRRRGDVLLFPFEPTGLPVRPGLHPELKYELIVAARQERRISSASCLDPSRPSLRRPAREKGLLYIVCRVKAMVEENLAVRPEDVEERTRLRSSLEDDCLREPDIDHRRREGASLASVGSILSSIPLTLALSVRVSVL
jgi:hypothetical protein